MTKRNRLLDILVILLGLAVLFDTSVQLAAADDNDVVWVPASDEESFEDAPFEELNPVFTA